MTALETLERLDATLAAVEHTGHVLTVRQLRLLLTLPAPGKELPSVMQVQRTLGFDKSVISRALDYLEKQRLVKRQPDPNHRGRAKVGLTSAGVTLRYRVATVLAGLETTKAAA